jgi:hypothetical protein
MIPQDLSRAVDNRPSPPVSATPGWQAEIPLQANHHVAACDRLMDAAEAQERRQQAQPVDFEQMMTVMAKMMEMQSQTLQAVAALMLKDNKPKKSEAKSK